MSRLRRLLLGLFIGLAPPAAALDATAPPPRPLAGAAPAAQCTPDGAFCLDPADYIPEICRLLDETARAHGIDRDFFLRLIWRESLFDARALSPAGAQGIAQFMPETAKLRGLSDAFNPAEALDASARYLADLSRTFGNIGLAAVAYNGGEARAERFVSHQGGLPLETRAYVTAITGHSAATWRDAPPKSVDLALTEPGQETRAFQAGCLAHAATRGNGARRLAPVLAPWGVVVASNRDEEGAARQVARLRNRHAAVLAGEDVAYSRGRRAGMSTRLVYAQIGRDSRETADRLCAELRATGGDCMVLRN